MGSRGGERWTRGVTRVLAPNPSAMSLDGTNTLIVAHEGFPEAIVVDPGPDDVQHLERVASGRDIRLILLTHQHADHSEGAARLSAMTGAPVRAFDAPLCIGAPPLRDGETIALGTPPIVVVSTPGHTGDSVCFHLPDDGAIGEDATGSMLTGDTILGTGTTVIAEPDGSLAAYLRSLDALRAFGRIPTLPAHGPLLPSLDDVAAAYIRHRLDRIRTVQDAIAGLGDHAMTDDELVRRLADAVYPDLATGLERAAHMMVRAHLAYLADPANARPVAGSSAGACA